MGTILIGIHGLNENSNGLTRYIELKIKVFCDIENRFRWSRAKLRSKIVLAFQNKWYIFIFMVGKYRLYTIHIKRFQIIRLYLKGEGPSLCLVRSEQKKWTISFNKIIGTLIDSPALNLASKIEIQTSDQLILQENKVSLLGVDSLWVEAIASLFR